MKYHFYAYMSRLKNIKRWNLMRNTREENVQEHSHNVVVISHALCLIRNRILGGNVDEKQVLAFAVYHDANEVITGDLPTPIKYFNSEIKNSYKRIEEFANQTLAGMLPEELSGEVAPYIYGEVPHDVKRIVKAADKLCAYIKCIEEKKSGNVEFERARRTIQKSLDKLASEMEEVKYFMEHFMPSFDMTLDELN